MTTSSTSGPSSTPGRRRAPAWKITIASQSLQHAAELAVACRRVGVGYPVGCALAAKESNGRNVYGADTGGALAGYPDPVNEANWRVFRWLVIDQGHVSNGVGPAQITYAGPRLADGTRPGGYFTQMEAQGLRPWDPTDNLTFGLQLLAGHWRTRRMFNPDDPSRAWAEAATLYNTGNLNGVSNDYGRAFVALLAEWRRRLHPSNRPTPAPTPARVAQLRAALTGQDGDR